MRGRFGWIAGVIGLGVGIAVAEPPAVEAVMMNGDVVPGVLRGFDGTAFALEPAWGGRLRVPGAYVGELMFDGGGAVPTAGPTARVMFVNGDRISGHVREVTGEAVTVETLWGERWVAERRFVERVEMLPPPEARIFEGVEPASAWRLRLPSGAGALERAGGAWVLPEEGRMERRVTLPERGGVLLEVELSFPAGETSATLEMFAGSGSRQQDQGMALSLNPSWMHVRARDGNGRQQWVMREPFAVEEAGELISVSVYLNVETGEAVLRINERVYPPFVLHAEAPFGGQEDVGVMLQAGRASGGVFISHVSLTRIRGGYRVEAEGEGEEERVVFANGDRMAAEIRAVDGERVVLGVEGGQEVVLPRERVRALVFGRGEPAFPRRRDRDVSAGLRWRGDRVTLGLEQFKNGVWAGHSDVWRGEIRVPAAELRRLRLNVYHSRRLDPSELDGLLLGFER